MEFIDQMFWLVFFSYTVFQKDFLLPYFIVCNWAHLL